MAMASPSLAQERPSWPSGALSPVTGAWPSAPAPQPKQTTPTVTPTATPPAQPAVRDADHILILIRSSLLTLNDALTTGNFTVLRDKVAPSIREQNTPARLYQTFAQLMQQRVDLKATAVLTPEMTEVPATDGQGRLNLKGVFRASDGGALMFHLVYESVSGQWLLYGASVNMASAAPAAAAAPAPAQARSASAPAPAPAKGAANPRPSATKQAK
jgi:hypothetical protein